MWTGEAYISLGIKLKINGREIEAKPGQKVLEAAKDHGIKIPHLCYHGQIGSIDSCRVCLVEVKPGPPKPLPACTVTVAEGMEIQTDTPRVLELRREMVQLLLMNHPLDCPVCDRAGECKLQNIVHDLGITEQKYRATPQQVHVDADSPLIERHPERCIHCGRCVTICDRIIGASGIHFANRGFDSEVMAGGQPLSCEFCGSCVAVCPVGALIDKTFKYRARAWDIEKRETACTYCGGGCRIELNVSEGPDGRRVRRVTSNHKKSFNRGFICGRGRFAHSFIGSGDRLKTPLIRQSDSLLEAGWTEALDAAASGLGRVAEEHGPESVWVLASPRLTNEANYLLQKLARKGLGTNNIDSQARTGWVQAMSGLGAVLGFPGVSKEKKLTGLAAWTGTIAELANSDAILVVGSDVRAEMPPYGLSVIAAVRQKGAYLATVNPRGTKMDRFARTRLRYTPGEETALLMALCKALAGMGVKGREGQPEGIEGFTESLAGVPTIEGAEAIARKLAGAERPAVIIGGDLIRTGDVSAKMAAVGDLLLILGPKARLYPVAEKANSRGLLDMGCCPEWLPGYAPAQGGSKDFLTALKAGEVKGLYACGANPLRGWPGEGEIAKQLANVEFLVAQDIFMTETGEMAHVVLPAASFAETSGTFTNTEGRQGLVSPALEPDGVLEDWKITAELGKRLDCPMGYKSADDVTAEIASLVPWYGMPFDELQSLPREFSGKLTPVEVTEPSSNDMTLLVAGSMFHSGTLTTRSEGPLAVEPEGRLFVSQVDAIKFGVVEGSRIKVEDGTGESIEAPVSVTGNLPEGLVLASDHFEGLRVHRLTSDTFVARVKLAKA